MKIISASFLLAVLLCLAALPLNAQVQQIITDKGPSAIFVDSAHGRVHVLTAGVDNATFGTFEPDSGDVLPRWFVLDAATNARVDSLTFDGYFNSFPIRAGVDLEGGKLYVAQHGRVRAYDLGTLKLIRDTVVPGNYSGVSFDPISGILICHMRGGGKPGYIVAVDPSSGDTIGITEAGIEPQMTVARIDQANYGPAFYTLNEGDFGKKNSSISYGSGNPDIFTAANGKKLGGGGNYIAVRDSLAYMVMNGTHQIRIVNTMSHKETALSPISTGTSSFNGPRTLAFQGNDTLVVATYNNDLRRFSLKSGEMIDSIAMPGKVETVLVRDSIAFASIKYGAGGTGYDPDSTVMIVNLHTRRIVDSIRVGVDPGTMAFDKRGDLHVFGYGVGDSLPWWMTFKNGGWAKKGEKFFKASLGFPFNVGYDSDRDSLYIALSDTIFSLSASNVGGPARVSYLDSTAAGDLAGVTAGNGYLFITEPPKNFGGGPGYVHVVSLADGHRVAKSRAGSYVAMAVPVMSSRPRGIGYYALNTGDFSSASSTLSFVQIAQSIFGGDSLGGGANHLLDIGADRAAVTMNGDHQIVFFTPDDWTINFRVPTGTSGFNGPRETQPYDPEHILVTTYAGDLRILAQDGGIRTIPTGGKAEGLAVLNGKIYVANPFNDDYSADSTVAIIDGAILSVERSTTPVTAMSLDQNFPNPATDRAHIHFTIEQKGRVELELYSTSGDRVKSLISRMMESGSYDIELSTEDLAAGSYIYRLQSGSGTASRIMQVVR